MKKKSNNVVYDQSGVKIAVYPGVLTRKMRRNLARVRMQQDGIAHPNKRVIGISLKSGMMERQDSFFSEHWRDYSTPRDRMMRPMRLNKKGRTCKNG